MLGGGGGGGEGRGSGHITCGFQGGSMYLHFLWSGGQAKFM